MFKSKRSNPEFVNGVPELLLLRLLARAPSHGYELVQAIRAASGQKLDFGEGCIYPILHRLERQGYLKSSRQRCGGRPRYVYELTSKGQGRLAEGLSLWHQVTSAVELVLQGGTGNVRSSLA